MPNREDITYPTTAMNMALALMAKAFKLNYSTPTNNNQRISSNLRNRQIAQPGRINLRRTSVTGFPAQSIRSSDAIATDLPYLLVLNTRASQSRQHGIDNTKTRRPQPRSNTTNDRVPSTSKSSCNKNKKVEVEEHHRKLLLSRNKKHMPSECNNVKFATQNVKSKVVCAMCKQCLISVNHDVCLLNYVNGMPSHGKKQKANVTINENQKKQKSEVKKPKKVGFIEKFASPKPNKPRSFLMWSLTRRLFDLKGKIIASSISKSQSDCFKGDNACTSNPLEPTIKRFPNSTFSLAGNPTMFMVHRLRTDNGTEFKNQVHKEYFDSVGISHKVSSVRTPQQNGVVERINRTLVEAARTMLIFSCAPLFLWAEAIATACFTQNRSIIHRRFNKTPYELINGIKSDISFLQVFGALCYPKNNRKDIRKLGAKGELDLLFEEMYDDYIGGQPSAASRSVPTAQAHQEHVEKGKNELYFVKTDYQLADIFTKDLPADRFNYLVRRLGMRSLSPKELERLAKSQNTPLDRVEVLGMIEKKSKSENKGIVQTEMELMLEQSQQSSSHEVLVSTEGVKELTRISQHQTALRIRRWRYNLTPAESKFKTPMLDHQDKHMMKAQVHVSKSSAIIYNLFLKGNIIVKILNLSSGKAYVEGGDC
nr:integrase, catalytic region, zinc finger, CCHC-type, peptidase aspartic, catalytic [Tanacetum cinerariifolium]